MAKRETYATVHNGRLVLDETPVDYPEGKRLRVVVFDEDELDEEERARLRANLLQSIAEADAGYSTSQEELFEELGWRK